MMKFVNHTLVSINQIKLRLAVGVVALAALMVGCNHPPAQPAEPTPNARPLVEFTAKDLVGNPVSLADYTGQVVLVNFWASWCTPCKAELPILQAYYQSHQGEGFVLLGVNVSEDAEDAAQFLEDNHYDFPAWSDPPGNALIQLRANGLPFSMLIDRDGRLIDRWMGPLTEEILEEVVTPLWQENSE